MDRSGERLGSRPLAPAPLSHLSSVRNRNAEITLFRPAARQLLGIKPQAWAFREQSLCGWRVTCQDAVPLTSTQT